MPATELLRATPAGIAHASELLRAGQLVAFPTETVYGLGGDARNDHAVAGIFQAKGRPTFNPLIVHLPDVEAVSEIAEMTATARALAAAFWPGPLTLVLPLRDGAGISPLVSAGLPTIALRVPAHPVAQALLGAAGIPIAAPSANPSGRISPTTADHVHHGLNGQIAAILDAGPCDVGVESTIVEAIRTPRLLRPGGVSGEDLRAIAPALQTTVPADASQPNAPGQLASHYAPRSPVRLHASGPSGNELYLGFGDSPAADLNLSTSGDLREAAANLFAMLHALDAQGRPIAVAPIPDHGLGLAINDRLTRAAAPRD